VVIKAVMFDIGGVLTTGPFEGFARYEREHGLPEGLIRRINSTNPDTNAWALFERGQVDFAGFCELFESEARGLGYDVDAQAVMAALRGEPRPEMVAAVRFCKSRFKTAGLTNNFASSRERPEASSGIYGLFDVLIESSKVGVRKPDPRFYELACEALSVVPSEAVFLDDLGINLKPARQMGMHTIKVTSGPQAVGELYAVLGVAPQGWAVQGSGSEGVPAMSGPLDDITVIEIANWIAAPSATALMADMGASVIKVEPPSGDSMRNKLRQPTFADGYPGTDIVFQLDNRGKRSIAVDLGDERGQDIVRELTDRADVIVTNLLRSRLERYGLGPDQLRKRNPGLVYAIVSGQGSTGEDADQLAFDVTAFFGRGGVTALLGEPDGLPVAPRAGQGDHPTGLALLVAILGALRVRDKTGEGQVVETALMRVGAWTVGCDVAAVLIDGRQPSKRSRQHPVSPMNTMYRCADGAWLILSSHNQGVWPGFCEALERPDLATDPRFETPLLRFQNAEELVGIFDAHFGSQPFEHWVPRLKKTGLIWAKMAELPDLIADPQAKEMGMFAELEHPAIGRFETLAAPFSFERSEVLVRGPAPGVGEHTEEVLAELDRSPEAIAELAEGGVVGVPAPPQ
jgi:epoxide hydrolase-like predicted phosphatase